MLKNLIEKVDYYWLFFIITIILCFGFFLTNSNFGIDDELLNWYGSVYSIVSIGRLGRILQWVIGYDYLPFFYDFIAILLYAIGITLSADCFMQYIENFTKKQATVFACIAVSFPFTAFLFAFIIITIHTGISIFLTALGTYLFCKYLFDCNKKRNLIFTFLCLITAVSLYENSIIYFLISMFFIILMSNKNRIKLIIKTIIASISPVIVYLFILKILKAIMGIQYNRSEEFIKYDFSSVTSFFNSFINSFNILFTNYIKTIHNNFGSFTIILSNFLFVFIIIYLAIKRKSINTIFVGLIMILLPISTFIIMGNGELYYRVYAPFGYFIGITFSILFSLLNNKKIITYMLTVFCILIVLNQAKEINKIFYTENIKFQDDLSFAKLIINDLKKRNLDKKPVILAGTRENIILQYNYYIEAPEIMISIFNWDKYQENSSNFMIERGFKFMKQFGLNIIPFREYTRNNMKKIEKEIPKMTIFPQNGSIKDMDNFVIIKIGKTYLDRN